ncbi:MAG: APC family permease, partial [Clostridiales bacterium]
WIASVASFFVGVLSALFFPNIPFLLQLGLMLIVVWVIVIVGFRPVDEAKWVSNTAAIVKLILAGGLILCAGFFLVTNGKPANAFTWADMKPSFDQSLTYLPALIYNFLGLEAMLTLAGHMKNPGKDIPKAVITNSILVASLYIITTLTLLILIPTGNLNIVSGIIDGFKVAIGSTLIGQIIIIVLGVAFLFTVVAQTASWLVAASRMAAAASDDGELPKLFGKRAKGHDAPIGALILIGIVGTALIVLYGAMASSAEDLFWTLFSFVSVVYILPFLINYQGYLKLRKTDKETVRPFVFPGPPIFAWFFAHFAQLLLVFIIMLFFWVPGVPLDWVTIIMLGAGVIISLVLGEYLTRNSLKKTDVKK